MKLTILVVGDEAQPEFAGPIARLARFGRVEVFADPERALGSLAVGHIVPELIVVAQSYPGQYPTEMLERLRGTAPLCRILALLGSWCEGELRSGQPWPSVVRLYWHQWSARAERELTRLARGECPSWGLPVTATDEERLQTLTGGSREGKPRFAAIFSRKRAHYEWLAAACRQRGWASVWIENLRQRHVQGVQVLLYDVSTDVDPLPEIQECARRFHPAPITVLADFPRIEDVRRMHAAGAAAVLPKPVLLEDLFWQLQQSADDQQALS
ncbi:MAG: response regulator transcription factor [Pirellulales bacterium]|nr:response regulator transcription factor [Pirellulales bacterium]